MRGGGGFWQAKVSFRVMFGKPSTRKKLEWKKGQQVLFTGWRGIILLISTFVSLFALNWCAWVGSPMPLIQSGERFVMHRWGGLPFPGSSRFFQISFIMSILVASGPCVFALIIITAASKLKRISNSDDSELLLKPEGKAKINFKWPIVIVFIIGIAAVELGTRDAMYRYGPAIFKGLNEPYNAESSQQP